MGIINILKKKLLYSYGKKKKDSIWREKKRENIDINKKYKWDINQINIYKTKKFINKLKV